MGEPEFTIDNADQYPEILRERGKVIADYEERKAKIKADAEEAARKIGGNADLSESLLEEVASLVECTGCADRKIRREIPRGAV